MKKIYWIILFTAITGLMLTSTTVAQQPSIVKQVVGTGGMLDIKAGGLRMWGLTGQVAIENKVFNGNTTEQGFWVANYYGPDDVGETVDSKSMLNNYPNPFSVYTVIKYSLQTTSLVTLKIFDMLGQEKITLANSIQNEGPQEITWYGTDRTGLQLPSGSYFYELQVTPAQIAGGDKVTQTLRNVMIIVR